MAKSAKTIGQIARESQQNHIHLRYHQFRIGLAKMIYEEEYRLIVQK